MPCHILLQPDGGLADPVADSLGEAVSLVGFVIVCEPKLQAARWPLGIQCYKVGSTLCCKARCRGGARRHAAGARGAAIWLGAVATAPRPIVVEVELSWLYLILPGGKCC